MKTFTYTITEEQGIHARPAGALVKEAKKYKSSIVLYCDDKTADASKLLAVMGLGTKKGTTLKIEVDGSDEENAFQCMKNFFETNL